MGVVRFARSVPNSEGRRLLLLALTVQHAHVVAARLRVSPSTLYSWRTGDRRPSPATRIALERVYGIPIASWDRPRR